MTFSGRLGAVGRKAPAMGALLLAAFGLAALPAVPAWARQSAAQPAAQTVGVVIDSATGLVQMIVVPDKDSDLSDPAYNPPGSVQVRLSRKEFQGATPEQFVARASTAAKRTLSTRLPPRAAPTGRTLTASEAAAFERRSRELAKVR